MLDALELQQAVSESQASRNACASSSVKGLECQLHAKTRQVLALQVDQTNQVEAAEMAENAMRGLWQQLKTLEAFLAQVYTETINVCLRSDAGATRLRMASVTVKRLKEASRDQAQAISVRIARKRWRRASCERSWQLTLPHPHGLVSIPALTAWQVVSRAYS